MALKDNLVSYWELEDTRLVDFHLDRYSTGNDLTNNASATFAAGKIDNAVTLNGSTQYLSIADATQAGLDVPGTFSVSVWVNWGASGLPADGSQSPIVSKYVISGSQRSYLIWLENNSGTYSLNLTLSSNGIANAELTQSITTPSTGTWYHYVVTYEVTTGNTNFYVDGSRVGDEDQVHTIKDLYEQSTAPFEIGRWNNGTNYSKISVDELGFWDRELTSDDVLDLNNSGSGLRYGDMDSTIKYDNSKDLGITDPGTTLTTAYTVTGTDPILFVAVKTQSAGGADIIDDDGSSNVQYDKGATGVNMTRISSRRIGSTTSRLYLYYMINPDTGSNNVVVTTNTSATFGAMAASYTNADQASQPDASNDGEVASAKTISISPTTVADNDWLVGCFDEPNGDGTNHRPGQNTRTRITHSAFGRFALHDSNGPQTPAAAYEQEYDWDTSDTVAAMLVAAFDPEDAATAATPQLMMTGVGS